MQLIIKKNKCNKSFVKGYLKLFLVASLRTEYDNERIATLDTYYDIDCKKVLEYSILSMKLYETASSYVLRTDSTKVYENKKLSELVYNITYGAREMKGYPILLNVFNKTANNIDKIYYRWSHGY